VIPARNRALGVLLLLAAFSSLPGAAETRVVDGVKVTIDSPWTGCKAGGYLPLFFTLANAEKGRKCVITVESRTTEGVVSRSVRTVSLAPREVKRVSLLHLPCGEIFGVKTRISVGEAVEETFISVSAFSSGHRTFLFVCRTWPPYYGVFESVFQRKGTDTLLRVSKVSPGLLSEGWISYAGVDAVFVDGAVFPSVPPERMTDLRHWVEMGGILVFYNAERIDRRSFHRLFPQSPFLSAGEAARAGERMHGKILLLRGFPAGEGEWRALKETHFFAAASISERHDVLSCPVPGIGLIPARGFFAAVLLFSIVVGPVNLFYLRRKKRETLLLVTVPAIALASGVAMYVYSFLSEGVSVKAVVASVTFLDRRTNTAYTDTGFSVYNAAFSAGDLHLSRDDCLLVSPSSREKLLLRDGGEDMVYSGIVPQRKLVFLRTLSVGAARERVELSREGETPVVRNGLSTAIEYIFLSVSGAFYACRDVPPGGRKRLVPVSKEISWRALVEYMKGKKKTSLDFMRKTGMFINSWLAVLKRTAPEGYFIGVMKENPFMNPALKEYAAVAELHVVCGPLEPGKGGPDV